MAIVELAFRRIGWTRPQRNSVQVYWFAKAVHSGERLERLVGDPNMSYSELAAAGISRGLSHIPWAESESKQSNLDKDKLGLFIEVLERFKDEVEEDQVFWDYPWMQVQILRV